MNTYPFGSRDRCEFLPKFPCPILSFFGYIQAAPKLAHMPPQMGLGARQAVEEACSLGSSSTRSLLHSFCASSLVTIPNPQTVKLWFDSSPSYFFLLYWSLFTQLHGEEPTFLHLQTLNHLDVHTVILLVVQLHPSRRSCITTVQTSRGSEFGRARPTGSIA